MKQIKYKTSDFFEEIKQLKKQIEKNKEFAHERAIKKKRRSGKENSMEWQ